MNGNGYILPGAVAQLTVDTLDAVRIGPAFDLGLKKVIRCHCDAESLSALRLEFERLPWAIG